MPANGLGPVGAGGASDRAYPVPLVTVGPRFAPARWEAYAPPPGAGAIGRAGATWEAYACLGAGGAKGCLFGARWLA